MSFFSRIISPARPKPKPQRPQSSRLNINPAWLDNARMDRVILHWTAGSHTASSLDKEHYHFLVEIDAGKPRIVRGQMPVAANTPPLREGKYAAHTLNTNSRSIGVSICAMAGAQENPFKPGKFPVTEGQWLLAAELVAALCRHYDIPVTRTTVLTHAEVQSNLGIKQRKKWDIARLAFDTSVRGAAQVGDDFRERVREAMK